MRSCILSSAYFYGQDGFTGLPVMKKIQGGLGWGQGAGKRLSAKIILKDPASESQDEYKGMHNSLSAFSRCGRKILNASQKSQNSIPSSQVFVFQLLKILICTLCLFPCTQNQGSFGEKIACFGKELQRTPPQVQVYIHTLLSHQEKEAGFFFKKNIFSRGFLSCQSVMGNKAKIFQPQTLSCRKPDANTKLSLQWSILNILLPVS